jgi:hypothetical protein
MYGDCYANLGVHIGIHSAEFFHRDLDEEEVKEKEEREGKEKLLFVPIFQCLGQGPKKTYGRAKKH